MSQKRISRSNRPSVVGRRSKQSGSSTAWVGFGKQEQTKQGAFLSVAQSRLLGSGLSRSAEIGGQAGTADPDPSRWHSRLAVDPIKRHGGARNQQPQASGTARSGTEQRTRINGNPSYSLTPAISGARRARPAERNDAVLRVRCMALWASHTRIIKLRGQWFQSTRGFRDLTLAPALRPAGCRKRSAGRRRRA